jgi:hypothetical protein
MRIENFVPLTAKITSSSSLIISLIAVSSRKPIATAKRVACRSLLPRCGYIHSTQCWYSDWRRYLMLHRYASSLFPCNAMQRSAASIVSSPIQGPKIPSPKLSSLPLRSAPPHFSVLPLPLGRPPFSEAS